MTTLLFFLDFILGAVSYRIRGGVMAKIMPPGDVVSRLVWAVSTTVLIYCLTLHYQSPYWLVIW